MSQIIKRPVNNYLTEIQSNSDQKIDQNQQKSIKFDKKNAKKNTKIN